MESALQVKDLVQVIRENVRARRIELGMTQAVLADEVDVSQPFVAALERGNRIPSVELLAKLSDALKTTPDALLTRGIFSETPA